MPAKVAEVDWMVKNDFREPLLQTAELFIRSASLMKARINFAPLVLFLIFLSALMAWAEERPNQLLTALDSSTISGYVDTSVLFPCTPNGARRSLVAGLYRAQVGGPKHSRPMKLALAVFPEGTGYCELGEYDSTTQLLTHYCSGSFTNRSNGYITGKFPQLHARFVGRVSKDQSSANLRLIIHRGGHEHVREVKFERAGNTTYGVQSQAAIWESWNGQMPDGLYWHEWPTDPSQTGEPQDPLVGAPLSEDEVRDYGIVVQCLVVLRPPR